MGFRRKKWVMGLALGVAALIWLTTPVQAAFLLRTTFTSGASSTEVIDNGAFDSDPTDNSIRFVGTVGSLDVNAAVSTTNTPGTPTLAFVKMTTGDVTNFSSSSQQLQVFTSAINFTAPASPTPVSLQSSQSMTVGSGPTGPSVVTANFTSFADPGNAFYGTTFSSPTVSLSEAVGDSGGVNAADTALNLVGPYSLSNRAIYTISGTTTADLTKFSGSGTTNIVPTASTVIPGPSGWALSLAGLPLLGLWFRRRAIA